MLVVERKENGNLILTYSGDHTPGTENQPYKCDNPVPLRALNRHVIPVSLQSNDSLRIDLGNSKLLV